MATAKKKMMSLEDRAITFLRALEWRDERFSDEDLDELSSGLLNIDSEGFRKIFVIEMKNRNSKPAPTPAPVPRSSEETKHAKNRTTIRTSKNSVDKRLKLYDQLIGNDRPLGTDELMPTIYPKSRQMIKDGGNTTTRSWSGSIAKLANFFVDEGFAVISMQPRARDGNPSKHWSIL